MLFNKSTILLIFAFISIQSTQLRAANATIKHFDFKLDNNQILITYDLEGDSSRQYQLELTLKKEHSPGYSLKPNSTTGDIGEGLYVGQGKKVIWYVDKDIHQPDFTDDFYFELSVRSKPIKKKFSRWYYYAGSAVIIGTAAAFGISSGGGGGGGGNPSIPDPPPRP